MASHGQKTNGASSQPRPRRSRRRWWILAIALLVASYPIFVLGTVYAITLTCDLPGGRHGPRDAYRHCLASAIVAFTASPRCVDWVNNAMEGDDPGLSHRMDAHNNRIGARIGATAAGWTDMLRAARAAVDGGNEAVDRSAIDAVPERIVWLPRSRWREREH